MRRLVLFALVAALMYSALSLVSSRYQTRQMYIELSRLGAVERDLEVDWRRLVLERAELTTNARIRQELSTKLKLQLPQLGQVRYVKEVSPVPQNNNTQPTSNNQGEN